MSWIFAISKPLGSTVETSSLCHETPLYTISSPGFYLAVGGNIDTCFWESNADKSKGWVVVGIGISRSGVHASILTQSDWEKLLKLESFDATSLDGHFVVLRWKEQRIECFTDQLGLRTLFYTKYIDGICISTRLDWVARTTGNSEIDFTSLGSRWLMLNQMSYESCIIGIKRLGPGGYANFTGGSTIGESNTPWTPDFESGPPDMALDILIAFLKCVLDHRYTPSLGLSGGLDSRLLLALLTNLSSGRFVTHTFGDTENPDVQAADRITTALKLPHYYFHDILPDVPACISNLRSYVAQVILTEPSTSFINLRYYRKLHNSNRIMIDGGFGEIARRQFLNRVVRFGRSALRSHDYSRLFKLMRLSRADIFSKDMAIIMETGARRSLNDVFEGMPSLDEIGIENYADLFTVRTRIPNYGGPEQARLDTEVLNFMPMAQPSFIRAVFRIPVNFRTNARFHYGIIRELNPILMRFPLVKSGFIYKFGQNKNIVLLASKLKSKLLRGYSDPGPHHLLNYIKEFVLDIAHSSEVTSNPIYNNRKIIRDITKYYQGEISLKGSVDWWLTFELWRRSLSAEYK